MQPDRESVARALAGDETAFADLVRKYEGVAFGLALSKLGSFTEAEDAAQDAFVAAYLGLGTLADADRFAPWLRGIVSNVCRMQHRRRAKEEILPPEVVETAAGHCPAPIQDEQYETKVLRREILEALGRLSPPNREAVVLYYLEEFSVARISRFLAASEAAILQRLCRARVQLRKEMLDMMEDVLTEARPEDLPEKVLEEIAERARQAHAEHLHAESVAHYDHALEVLHGLPESESALAWQAQMHRERANAVYFLHSVNDDELRIADLEAALAIERGLGRLSECAALLRDLGIARISDRVAGDARPALEESCELFRRAGEAGEEAWSAFWLARLETSWMGRGQPQLSSERIDNATRAFQRAQALFEEAGEMQGQSLSLATLEFLHALAADLNPDRLMVGGVHSIALEWREDTLRFGSEPGFSRSQTEMPRSMDHHIAHPDEFLQLPAAVGTSWTRPSFAYGQERMRAALCVESDDARVEVPAGQYEGCLLVRTDFRREGEDPSEHYQRLNLRNSGIRYQWYAPGVGMVKVLYEHGDGVVSTVELTQCEKGEHSADPWPLLPGYVWWYRCTDSRSEAAVLDRLWVATQDAHITHLAGYSLTEVPVTSG